MKFMGITSLWELGYMPGRNKDIVQGMESIPLDYYDIKETLTGLAYSLKSGFYFSIVFYNNEFAYSVVKIGDDVYESWLKTKEDIESAIEHSYDCDDIAIFKLKDEELECIGYWEGI